MRIVKHNGFTRETLERHEVKSKTESCAWCGEKNARGWLYRYAVVRYDSVPDDSNKRHWLKGCFCSVCCMRAYHA